MKILTLEAASIVRALSKQNRQWIDLAGRGEIYLRRAAMELHSRERSGLAIANVGVKVEYRRQGVFSNAVKVVERAAALMGLECVYVEDILNPVLVPALEERGYTIVRHRHNPIMIDGHTLHSMGENIEAYRFLGAPSNAEPRPR
jgi:hypothetical protein